MRSVNAAVESGSPVAGPHLDGRKDLRVGHVEGNGAVDGIAVHQVADERKGKVERNDNGHANVDDGAHSLGLAHVVFHRQHLWRGGREVEVG